MSQPREYTQEEKAFWAEQGAHQWQSFNPLMRSFFQAALAEANANREQAQVKQMPAPAPLPPQQDPLLRHIAQQDCISPRRDCYYACHCHAYANGHFMPDPPAVPAKLPAWIGVDLDGTLAEYDGWHGVGHIGAPVPAMLARVKDWLALGLLVKVFTARVSRNEPEAIQPIEAWCKKHIGRVLPITCVKDMAMTELWDDRAVQVEINTGRRLDGKA